jgi:DNA-binding NarL/FixJ family response regulator
MAAASKTAAHWRVLVWEDYESADRSACPPDIVLMSTHTGPLGETDIRQRIESALERSGGSVTSSRAIVIGCSCEISEIAATIRAGAYGFFSTAGGIDLLLAAIALVRAGGIFLPASVVLELARQRDQCAQPME